MKGGEIMIKELKNNLRKRHNNKARMEKAATDGKKLADLKYAQEGRRIQQNRMTEQKR